MDLIRSLLRRRQLLGAVGVYETALLFSGRVDTRFQDSDEFDDTDKRVLELAACAVPETASSPDRRSIVQPQGIR